MFFTRKQLTEFCRRESFETYNSARLEETHTVIVSSLLWAQTLPSAPSDPVPQPLNSTGNIMYGLQTPEHNIPDPMAAGSSRLVDACGSDLLVSFQNAL